jgi:hypothetical protein
MALEMALRNQGMTIKGVPSKDQDLSKKMS